MSHSFPSLLFSCQSLSIAHTSSSNLCQNPYLQGIHFQNTQNSYDFYKVIARFFIIKRTRLTHVVEVIKRGETPLHRTANGTVKICVWNIKSWSNKTFIHFTGFYLWHFKCALAGFSKDFSFRVFQACLAFWSVN